jgi:hypothetical protein
MTGQTSPHTEVRTYPDKRVFRQESDALARDGWEVVRIGPQDMGPGCSWSFFGRLFIKPSCSLVVTYRKPRD